jgi:hypothetical protein
MNNEKVYLIQLQVPKRRPDLVQHVTGAGDFMEDTPRS